MPEQTQVIKLSDGTEPIPLEKEEKEKLEAELLEVLNKYNAAYLPVIQKEESITNITQKAALFLLKKKAVEAEVVSPYTENGESTDTPTEETPKAD